MSDFEPDTSRRGAGDLSWDPPGPAEHLVQLYAEEGAFLDTLEGFVHGGLVKGEAVIVIATAAHRDALYGRLQARGLDLPRAIATDQYIALDAADTLAKFMTHGWPDPACFRPLVRGLLERARLGHARVRAFGEMVAVMWARGEQAAALHLERLWHELCRAEDFSLLCAYPRSGFRHNAEAAIARVCATHSGVVH